jgi:hypothetical protein
MDAAVVPLDELGRDVVRDGQRPPVVRDAATRVTSTNDEQGVAMVLESLLAGAADAG